MVDLCRMAEELWRVYFTGTPQDMGLLVENMIDPGCVIIGTGRHEFYESLEQFRMALADELQDRPNAPFQFENFRCEALPLSEDVCLVYGLLSIRWKWQADAAELNMDSRFSMIFRRSGEQWRLMHIHQSLPNIEQADGEYYPKTLMQQYNAKTEEVEHLQALAEQDSLTGLVNYRTFQRRYDGCLAGNRLCWLLVVDVDKFKFVNDTYGHLAGNRVLQRMAETLAGAVHAGDMVCRMGGDEFVLLCSGPETDGQARALVERLRLALARAGEGEPVWANVSIGAARATPGAALEEVFAAADAALYRDKKGPRG